MIKLSTEKTKADFILSQRNQLEYLRTVLNRKLSGRYLIQYESKDNDEIEQIMKEYSNALFDLHIITDESIIDRYRLYHPDETNSEKINFRDIFDNEIMKLGLKLERDSYWEMYRVFKNSRELFEFIVSHIDKTQLITLETLSNYIILSDSITVYRLVVQFLKCYRWRWSTFKKVAERFSDKHLYRYIRSVVTNILNDHIQFLSGKKLRYNLNDVSTDNIFKMYYLLNEYLQTYNVALVFKLYERRLYD